MDNSQRNNPHAAVAEAAENLVHESKKWAHEMQQEGMKKVCQAEENIKECSDQLLRKVQENPLASVLIASGVGFLLAKIMGK